MERKSTLHVADAVADMLTDREATGGAFRCVLDARIAQRAEQVAVLRLAQRLLDAANEFDPSIKVAVREFGSTNTRIAPASAMSAR